MPSDSTPISVAFSRFATMTTDRPTSASGRYARAMPATRVRSSAPRLTVTFNSFLDFGIGSAATTLATRNVTFMKSSNGIRVSIVPAGV